MPPSRLAPDNFDAIAATAWLFVRGAESVRITRTALPDGTHELVIQGPNDAEQRMTFCDLIACVEQQMDVEYSLLVRGFHLDQLAPDRRRETLAPFALDRRRSRPRRPLKAEC